MKIQIRKNILTHLWEVQKQEQAPSWTKIAEFATKEQAEIYAKNAQKSTGDKLPAPKKKSAQKANKRAKKTK